MRLDTWRGLCHRRLQSTIRSKIVEALRLQRRTAGRLPLAIRPQTERLQQAFLENPQSALRCAAAAQRLQCRVVVVEELRMRVMPDQELQQQLVHVEAADDVGGWQCSPGAVSFDSNQGSRLTATTPRDQQPLKGL